MDGLFEKLEEVDRAIEVNHIHTHNALVCLKALTNKKYSKFQKKITTFAYETIVKKLGRHFVEYTEQEELQQRIRNRLLEKYDYRNKHFPSKKAREAFLSRTRFESVLLMVVEYLGEEKQRLDEVRDEIRGKIEEEREFIVNHVLGLTQREDDDDGYDEYDDDGNLVLGPVDHADMLSSMLDSLSTKFKNAVVERDDDDLSVGSGWSSSSAYIKTFCRG